MKNSIRYEYEGSRDDTELFDALLSNLPVNIESSKKAGFDALIRLGVEEATARAATLYYLVG